MKSTKLRLTIELPALRRGQVEMEITAALKRSLRGGTEPDSLIGNPTTGNTLSEVWG